MITRWLLSALTLFCSGMAAPVLAQQTPEAPPAKEFSATGLPADWHYGAYVDLSYIVNFNFPENHLWRSRSTAFRHNELAPNMALAYVRKDLSVDSRWGMELGLQDGYDTQNFAFLQGEREVAGADTLRHFHRANVSYLAPIGTGLTITAGLFNSLIGYESLYAKDNFNYTRSWMADNTPYMMFGAKASYSVSEELTGTLFVINGYYHLANPNDQPSYGTQVAWKPTSKFTLTETFYAGPDQPNTSLEFWRLYLNNIAEWKDDRFTIALSYDIGTENIERNPGSPRAFVMAGALFTKWNVSGPWSVAARPEFYWDRNGRWTGHEQFVKAMTTTLEYKIPYRWTNTMLRLEHRFDESTGAGGGFFKDGNVSPGMPGLTNAQHLLLFSVLWTFDSP